MVMLECVLKGVGLFMLYIPIECYCPVMCAVCSPPQVCAGATSGASCEDTYLLLKSDSARVVYSHDSPGQFEVTTFLGIFSHN